MRIFFAFFLLLTILFSCKYRRPKSATINNGQESLSQIQQLCIHRLTNVIVFDIFTPPVAARIYAYANLAFYEALHWKINDRTSITGNLKKFDVMPRPQAGKEYNYNLASVKAFFSVAKALVFSKDSLAITERQILNSLEQTDKEDEYNNSLAFGDSVAAVILKRAEADNYKITRGMAKYSVFNEKGKWQQTPPDYADAVEPYWNKILPLLLDSSAQFSPPQPPPFDLNKSSLYYKELMEVYSVSKNISLTEDTIAHYWDDNPFVTEHKGHLMYATKKTTPAGHWMGITSALCGTTRADDVRTAFVYAVTSSAIFDAFISCWDEKYRSRTIRPISVIRENIEPEWSSFLQTPPFPEYTSGHSVISSAAAEVLSYNIGNSVAFLDTTEREYLGLQRSFSSVNQAAEEACLSRLYGGIHFRSAIEKGQQQGKAIGKLYNTVFFK